MSEINKDMLIGEILNLKENAQEVLTKAGMHCLGCPASQGETLEEACQVHGIDCDELVKELNK